MAKTIEFQSGESVVVKYEKGESEEGQFQMLFNGWVIIIDKAGNKKYINKDRIVSIDKK